MITIRALLDRIRWDPEYGRGEFAIGYYDRLEERMIRVPLAFVQFAPDDHFSFQLTDTAGEPVSVPLHRVCAVYRNGELIWHRERVPPGRNDF